jgi:hypothetical protein
VFDVTHKLGPSEAQSSRVSTSLEHNTLQRRIFLEIVVIIEVPSPLLVNTTFMLWRRIRGRARLGCQLPLVAMEAPL